MSTVTNISDSVSLHLNTAFIEQMGCEDGWLGGRRMKNSPIAFALYCDRQLVLVLVLVLVFALLQGCFPVETTRLGLSCHLVKVKNHSISQISDFELGEREGVGEFQRVVASPTPLLPSCKGNISCPSAANTSAEYAQTDRCMLL